MSLIRCSRHTRADLDHWETYRSQDEAWANTAGFRARCADAIATILEFAEHGPCYAGTSWGKDSTALAHLVWTAQEEHGAEITVAFVRGLYTTPETDLVRDEFRDRFDIAYHEILEPWFHRGLKRVEHELGTRRYLSGVRAEESGRRLARMRRFGHSTATTCAPIGWWTPEDVFAYLRAHDLPIHPAYAMSCDGALDRNRIRVADIGNPQGMGFGRGEWERRYYPDIPRWIEERWRQRHDVGEF